MIGVNKRGKLIINGRLNSRQKNNNLNLEKKGKQEGGKKTQSGVEELSAHPSTSVEITVDKKKVKFPPLI